MHEVSNPPNPWAEHHLEYEGQAALAELSVFEERAKSALAKNESPDVPFRYSLNPYRGCFHGCAYCYARPSHQYLGFGAGTDFDRKIVVKTNIAELLDETFDRVSWRGEPIVLSGNTDCYQPLEASYQLTRKCLEVCVKYQNPVSVITKGALVVRDIDLLGRLAREADARVFVSIPFADKATGRLIEPFASSIPKRFECLKRLSDAGIETGVSISPIIPGLNDPDIPEVLERAHEAGARSAFIVLLRLPREVLPVFDERLEAAFPARADKIRSAIRQARGGRANQSSFGKRMRGSGPRWAIIEDLFNQHRTRLGMNLGQEESCRQTFRRPTAQLSLFE